MRHERRLQISLPDVWGDTVRDAVALRNHIVHSKDRPRVAPNRSNDFFEVIRAIIDGLEHYRGVSWAEAWPTS
jgi:hypothetical protein